ncbi:uncharacterized protein LOC119726355 [Patiria miniata]|uniref:CCHC-type domain-containing protein n=1 Tax=Patiria miniata TaxID=46514 RepID=A0A913ZQ79_PATMI|nr:uncharacterized protein LOC119726355 [Patiria miniata]
MSAPALRSRIPPTPKPRRKFNTFAPPPTPVPTQPASSTPTADTSNLVGWTPSRCDSEVSPSSAIEDVSLRVNHSAKFERGELDPFGAREKTTTKEKGSCESSTSTSKRPNILTDRFNGKTPWREYKQHFKACKLANAWTDSQAKAFLAASLQSAAVKVLGNLASSGKDVTYTELICLLEKRFGPGQMAENHLVELRHRRQGDKETLQELGQSIRDLSALAYPELTDDGRDRLARGHFSDAIREQAIREGVFRARPSSLDEAIRAALSTESFLKIEEQRSDRRVKYARGVDGISNDPMQEVKSEESRSQVKESFIQSASDQEVKEWLQRMTKMLEDMKSKRNPEAPRGPRIAARRKATPQDVCFKCNNRGHFARECRKRVRHDIDRQASGNDSQLAPRPKGTAGEIDGPKHQNGDNYERPSRDGRDVKPTVGQKARAGLFVQAFIRGVKANLLVDTGATDSVLSSEFYYKIPIEKRPKLESGGTGVRNADGSNMETLGRALVDVQIGRTTCPVRAVFGKIGEVEGILGMDFLLPT